MLEDDVIRIGMDLDKDRLPRLFPLLGSGFDLRTEVDLMVSDWFCRQPGLAADYLQNRVQTIFLDGRAVDDPERAMLRDGSVLALSAAMPGLVGATFREGGRYAALRCEISHGEEKAAGEIKMGFLTVKLFNMVAAEIGPVFLQRAIRVKGGELALFLKRLPESFWQGCRNIRVGGRSVAASDLVSRIIEKQRVWLQVALF